MTTPRKMPRVRLNTLIDNSLYDALEAMAGDERREFDQQVIIILERAVKQHIGQKRAAERRRIRGY